jgi:tetratricopeptide (TPR) repeat protein
MKLLVTVGVVCGVMIGAAVWVFWPMVHPAGKSAPASPQDVVAVPRATPTTPAAPDAARMTHTADALPAGGALPLDADVHWPRSADPAAAVRRLDLARGALRDAPNHETALRDELAALADLGRWFEASKTLERLRALHPDDLGLRFDQAAVLLRQRRAVEAVPLLKEVVAGRPEDARAWFNLAVAHQTLGHLHEARQAWDRAIELKPTALAHAQRGTVLLDMREYAAAAGDFEAVLEHEPLAPDATLNLALALWKSGRPDDARTRLRGLLGANPQNVPAWNRLAEIAWESYRLSPKGNGPLREEALASWRRSLELDPGQTEIAANVAEAGSDR